MAPPVKYATDEEKREARIASKKRYYQRHKEAEQEKARLRWRARKQRERVEVADSPYSSPAYGSPDTQGSTSPQASPSPPSSPPLSPPGVDDLPGVLQGRETRTPMLLPSPHIGLSPNSPSSLPSPTSTTTVSLASPAVNDIERPPSPSDRFLPGRLRTPAWPTLSHFRRSPLPCDASAGAPRSNPSPKLAAPSAPVSAA